MSQVWHSWWSNDTFTRLQSQMNITNSYNTRSSAVAKRPRDASCLYSFYTLEWCGYPMVKKIRTYVYSFWHDPRTWKKWRFHEPQPTLLFPLETSLRLLRNMLHVLKDNSMLAKFLAAYTYLSSIISELYDVKSMRKSKNRNFFYHISVSHGDAPRAITLSVVSMERKFDAYKLFHCMYPSIFNSFPVIRTGSAKNCHFHVPQPTFLFSLETPLWLSRNMLHGWKDNSMLAKRLAACTYLSSIVSELYDA